MNDQVGSVLVVDDNPQNRMLAGESLADAGYRVLMAENGTQAISVAEELLPDVILLDIMMPGMDGYAVCDHLRKSRWLGNTKIIFLSAKAMAQDKVKGLEEHNGDDYLTKPYIASELIARVNTQYRAKRAMDERDAVNRVVKADLDLGAAMQRQFLTREEEVKNVFAKIGYDAAVHNRAPETVSGDLFFPKEISKNAAGFFLADVCGHGIPAALISMRMLSVVDNLRSPNHHPSEFLETLNGDIQAIMPKGRFVAAQYMILDHAGYSVASAAQPYPVKVGKDGNAVEITIDGPPLGQGREIQFEDATGRLEPGEELVLYTDGIIEASNPDGVAFGERRLLDSLARHGALPAEGQCERVIADAVDFMRGGNFDDDVTLAIFKKCP